MPTETEYCPRCGLTFEELPEYIDPEELTGALRIIIERHRQVAVEGFDAKNDSRYTHAELVRAGICYASTGLHDSLQDVARMLFSILWPFDRTWDKRVKHGVIRSLEIAGAFIAAEIDNRIARRKP